MKTLLIYNPNAGTKRRMWSWKKPYTLEDIKNLFIQYQIEVDYEATKKAGDAIVLVKKAVKKGYELVIAAGGDGTISEVASGLIDTEVNLGILPLGSMMNTAWMLAIPKNLEMAVAIIKIGRVRKIDVGVITKMNDERLSKPHYFLENAGLGLEAKLQKRMLDLENKRTRNPLRLIKAFFDYYHYKTTVIIDESELKVRSPLIEVSNGSRTGAAWMVAPDAKLNDHKLTVSVFRMDVGQIVSYFIGVKMSGKFRSKKIKRYQGSIVKIVTKLPKLIHADGRVFGKTPVEFRVKPNALNVITGFPADKEQALSPRTRLDP